MTEELLAQGNNLKARIKEVSALLEQIDLTDPSGINPDVKTSPIMVQAGMAKTIQFDVVGTREKPTEVQVLDNKVHESIIHILTQYRNKLVEMFKELK